MERRNEGRDDYRKRSLATNKKKSSGWSFTDGWPGLLFLGGKNENQYRNNRKDKRQSR